jgi:uncharacterized protein YbaA (DUF1428 family)
MAYIDGFVIPMRTANKQAYRELATTPFDAKRMIVGGFDVLVDSEEGLQ